MPLDSKQQIINDLISVLEHYPGSDPRNIAPIIYRYARTVPNERQYFVISDIISNERIINLIQSYSCPLIGSNPSPSTTFTFYCKLDGYKYPRYQLKAIIKK